MTIEATSHQSLEPENKQSKFRIKPRRVLQGVVYVATAVLPGLPVAVENLKHGLPFITPLDGFIAVTFSALIGTSLNLAIEELAKAHENLAGARTMDEVAERKRQLISQFLDEKLMPIYKAGPYPDQKALNKLAQGYGKENPIVRDSLLDAAWMQAADRRMLNLEKQSESPYYQDDPILSRLMAGIRPMIDPIS